MPNDSNAGGLQDSGKTNEVSPTGEPFLTQRQLRIALVVYVVLLAAEGGLAAWLGGDHPAVKAVLAALGALAVPLGVMSPGLRRTK